MLLVNTAISNKVHVLTVRFSVCFFFFTGYLRVLCVHYINIQVKLNLHHTQYRKGCHVVLFQIMFIKGTSGVDVM